MTKRVLTILGNRPQFIKAALVSEELKKNKVEEIIINTGQHYDPDMSDIFIQELKLPAPSKNLDINKCSSVQMIGKIMEKLEQVCEATKPSHMLVYGDTTSTLAAALTAVKMSIPVVHVEAGPRMGNIRVPEEYNRIIVDRSSDILFCPDKTSVENLTKEGISNSKIFFVGDVLYDLFVRTKQRLAKNDTMSLENQPILLTLHRQHNVDNPEALAQIIDILNESNYNYVFPVHPRTKQRFIDFGLDKKIDNKKIKLLSPLSYFDTMKLLIEAQGVVTDSGGLQKEAYFAHKPSYVFLDSTPWPEIEAVNWQKVMGYGDDLKSRTINFQKDFAAVINQGQKPEIFGDGTASKKIAQIIGQL